ncbi:MAG: PrsW family intramembrane metalloprotease [Chloroflexi bacterium]|nr:PrsW family intramembrane metalloprotease [Chloroflexota bacterium]
MTQSPTPAAAAAAPPLVAAPPVDWTEQVSLFQPRQAAFWLYALLVAIGGLWFLEMQATFADRSATAWILGVVLLALYAVPVFLVVNMLDLFEREPRSLLLGAFVWGGVVATFLAATINTAWSEIIQKLVGAEFEREWGAALTAPVFEELTKFLGVLVIFLIARHEFDDTLDGFVYGALVGLGFAVVENMYYFFGHFIGAGGGSEIGGLIEGFFVRVIVGGPYTHVLWTAISGMGLAYFVTRLDVPRDRRLLIAVGLYLAGVGLHFLWNSPILNDALLRGDPGPINWLIWAAIKGLPFLVFVAFMVRLATRHQQRWFRDALAPELAAGTVTAEEIEQLDDLRSRRAARKAVALRKGPLGERLMARLQHAQIALGVALVGKGHGEAERAADRERIAALRTELAALPDVVVPVAPAVQVTAPVTSPAAAARWIPTHLVPPEGLPSWDQPDPARPVTQLAGNLPLAVVQRVGDWARVSASNGWSGWVDGRRLVAMNASAG